MSNYPEGGVIYKLTCNINGKIYIGKSVNLYNRVAGHKRCGKIEKTTCPLQLAIKKYGWCNFSVEILELYDNFDKVRDNKHLLERETYYIDLFDATNTTIGYNICKFSNDRSGVKCSEETKRKISISNTGRKRNPFSEETKENMRLSALTRPPRTDEHRANLRKANLGKKISKEQKEKLREANLGKKISEDHKEKLRYLYKGKPSNRKNFKHSEESKEKIRQAMIGRKFSEESIQRMSIAQKGITNKRPEYKHSEETKEKMRQSAKNRKKVTDDTYGK
jgi:group I intron endonuclease